MNSTPESRALSALHHVLVNSNRRFEVADRLFLFPGEMLGPVTAHLIAQASRRLCAPGILYRFLTILLL
jgi:hypothetical protein